MTGGSVPQSEKPSVALPTQGYPEPVIANIETPAYLHDQKIHLNLTENCFGVFFSVAI